MRKEINSKTVCTREQSEERNARLDWERSNIIKDVVGLDSWIDERGSAVLEAMVADDTLAVDVFDRGKFIERAPRPNRGFGMKIVKAIAQDVSVDVGDGTHVRMIFTLSIAQ